MRRQVCTVQNVVRRTQLQTCQALLTGNGLTFNGTGSHLRCSKKLSGTVNGP